MEVEQLSLEESQLTRGTTRAFDASRADLNQAIAVLRQNVAVWAAKAVRKVPSSLSTGCASGCPRHLNACVPDSVRRFWSADYCVCGVGVDVDECLVEVADIACESLFDYVSESVTLVDRQMTVDSDG